MKNSVSKDEVLNFKEKWCKENEIIAELLRVDAEEFLVAPILDVGTGIGDLAYNAFPDKEAVCIDVNKIEDIHPLSKKHRRIQIDFFEYVPDKQIKTVFISHTLQFIDFNISKLNQKIKELNPDNIIIIINANIDFMGEVIEWTEKRFKNANPEIHQPSFPKGYSVKKNIHFQATVSCPSFDELVTQISYLMLVDFGERSEELKLFLKQKLDNTPMFCLSQTIEIYKKNEK
jgi:hypothetical protein